MKQTAYCKINLTLEILGTERDDGFHDIKSVMHKIPLGDEIELDARDGSGKIEFFCDSDVCAPEDNLAYKAASMYLEAYEKNTGKKKDVFIRLEKITPTGAGLGGGSADAARVLDMLSCLEGGVSDEQILSIATLLGSDVPFCLKRYTSALCTGRGEICVDSATLPKNVCMVVAKPDESINTKGIYGEYDKMHGNDYSKCMSEKMQKALCDGDVKKICQSTVNDFEEVCIPRLSEIAVIKTKMLDSGALCSQMSGSGSAVFGIFDAGERAKSCYEALLSSGLRDVFVFYDTDFEKMYKDE